MVSFKGIVSIMGWIALTTWLYSLTLPKIRHQRRQMVEKLFNESWEWGACEAQEDFS
jgi:hypothetical protein